MEPEIINNNKQNGPLMGEVKCTKNFLCAQKGFVRLCKAEDPEAENFIECHDDNPLACSHSMQFSKTFYCKCPIRVHIAKRFNR